METHPAQRLEITLDGPNHLSVAGELDAHTAPELHEAVANTSRDDDLVIDGSALTFVDSSGLRVLLEARSTWSEAGHRVVVRQPSQNLRRILEVTGLIDHFTESD